MPRKSNTRAPQGSGTIRKYNDTTWQGRVTLGRDPGTGKQIQKSVYGKSQAEVQKKMNALLAEIDKGIYTEPSKLTVGQWLDIWLQEYTGGIKPQTKGQYEQVCRVHLKPSMGKIKLSALKPHPIQALYNKLVREEGKSPKTVKNINGVLHKAMQQAVMLQYIPVNPCLAVQLPKVEKPDIKPLDEAQINAFLAAIKGSEYEDIFKVDLFTGMRQGEIMGLTWDRIDFAAGTILIDRQMIRERVKGGLYKFASTKTDKVRKLKPAPFVMEILQKRRKKQLQDRLLAGNMWDEGNFAGAGLVFTNAFGAHYGKATLTHHITQIGAKIGAPGLRFHDLRHSYAVASIRAGDDIKTISSNLGHATVAMTMDIYAHYTEDMRNDSSRRMQEYSERFKDL